MQPRPLPIADAVAEIARLSRIVKPVDPPADAYPEVEPVADGGVGFRTDRA